MQALYESVKALLDDDEELASMLHTNSDPMLSRVFKTSVQDHVQAASEDIRWVTFNVVADEPEPLEQTQDVKVMQFAIHVWAREDTEEVVERIVERVRDILNGADLATEKLLAWYCYWVATQQPVFEQETAVWHALSRYTCMVMLAENAP